MTKGPLARYRALVERGDLKADRGQADAAEALERLHCALAAARPRRGLFGGGPKRSGAPVKGLYLHGEVGRGKSMLMDLFFEGAPVRTKRRVHFHEFMLEIHAAVKAWRDLSDRDKKRRLKDLKLPATSGDDPVPPVARQVADSAPLLCFDELQVTDVADAMILGRLFEALFGFEVVMVATSNRHPGELYKDGLNRQLFLPFIELIETRLEVVELDGDTDHRLQRLKGMAVYHTPLGPAADAAMAEAWKRMTGTAKGAPAELEVMGRRLQVPQAAMGAARFTFRDLCAKPLGAADYLALAHAYHTVFLDHIPRLGPEKRNEAKRFVTLIDALYEAKVKLICSAEAEPVELYPAGDGAFEFGRTASRLIEMQSESYMALGHGG